jgi:hypothetical protein
MVGTMSVTEAEPLSPLSQLFIREFAEDKILIDSQPWLGNYPTQEGAHQQLLNRTAY